MSLSLTPLPSDRRAADLLPNTDPLSGIVTFTARPSRHAWAISQTVLHAIGARSDVFGAGRRHGDWLRRILRYTIRAHRLFTAAAQKNRRASAENTY